MSRLPRGPDRLAADLPPVRTARASRPARRVAHRWKLVPVQRLAAVRGMRVEKLVLCRGNVTRYALFRDGALSEALEAVFYARLDEVVAALTQLIGD